MRKLYDLEPAEVSLVPKGANKRKFMIFKKHPDTTSGVNPDPKGAKVDKELLEKIKKADPAVMNRIEEIIKEDAAMNDGQGLDNRAQAALKAVVRILMPFKEQITDDVLDQALGAAGFGEMANRDGGAADAGSPGEGEAGNDVEKECSPEHMEEAKKSANEAYKSYMSKMGYEKYPPAEMQMKSIEKDLEGNNADEDDEGEEDGVEKAAVMKADGTLDLSAVPASVRPALEAIYKGNLELVKKNADLEKQLKEERDQRKTKEFVEKAAALKNIGSDKGELATVLRSLAETNPEAYEKIEKTLQAADQAIGQGNLFKELGTTNTAKGGSQWDMIEKAAEGWVAKSGTKISKADAVEAFCLTPEGQKMYAEYKIERGGI